MFKNYVIALMCVLMISGQLFAKEKASVTALPDISVIGNFVGIHSDEKKQFDVKEIEFSFQHYLYPTVKADIFTALHKEDGQRVFELEEGYVTFTDLLGVLLPSYLGKSGLGSIVGKKLLNVGKINQLHPEQWSFADRSVAVSQFLGGSEGISGEGGQLMYLLPVPFFSQLEIGYWFAGAHAHGHEAEGEEEGEEDDSHAEHNVGYENKLVNLRLWNSLPLNQKSELQFGLNYLLGNVHSSDINDQQELMGVDLTLMHSLPAGQSLTLSSEIYQAKYGEEEGEAREKQMGYVLSGLYRLNTFYEVGLRYSALGKHGDDGEDKSQLSFMAMRQLTETSKFRLQYNTGEHTDNMILAQFVFGMGPHSHVLQ